MARLRIILLALGLLVAVGAARFPEESDKELMIRLQGEILVLQRQIRDLQESFDKSQGQTFNTIQRISDQAEHALRRLTALEESIKTVQTSQHNNLSGAAVRLTKLSEQIASTNQRLAQITSQIAGLRDHLDQQLPRLLEAEKRASSDEEPNLESQFNSPEELYALAFGQLTKGHYSQAITLFRQYVESHNHSEAADNAQFWIAEALVSQGRYAEALREYDRLLKDYPQGDKAPAAYLKKGILSLQLERRDEGVVILKTLVNSYPHSPEARQASQELLRLGESPQSIQPPTAKPGTQSRPKRPAPSP
jgi:tol-pal system protein YbgF